MSIDGINLKDQHVVLSGEAYKGRTVQRVFLCQHGSGCKPYLRGPAIFGEFVFDGEETRISQWDVLRLASDEEVEDAKKLREKVIRFTPKGEQ